MTIEKVNYFILCSIVYFVVMQITLFTAIFCVIWSLSILCADYIDKLLLSAFYWWSFYCTHSNVTLQHSTAICLYSAALAGGWGGAQTRNSLFIELNVLYRDRYCYQDMKWPIRGYEILVISPSPMHESVFLLCFFSFYQTHTEVCSDEREWKRWFSVLFHFMLHF